MDVKATNKAIVHQWRLGTVDLDQHHRQRKLYNLQISFKNENHRCLHRPWMLHLPLMFPSEAKL